jgi:hypothetical protein
MKYLLPLIFIMSICSCTVSKRTEKLVYGKWEFSSIKNESINETSEDFDLMIDHLLTGSSIEFMKDKTFQYHILNKTEIGFWNISEDGRLINFTDKPYYFQIVKISEDMISVNQIKNDNKVLLTFDKISD